MQAAAIRIFLVLPALAVLSACGRAQAEGPTQPIAFMHDVHVTDNEMECAYCHFAADQSEEAGVPSVGTCVGCHRFIRGSTPEYQEQIQLLMGFWTDSLPVPWVRVYSVPEFVQFSHKPHIRAEVECVECHGEVETMAQVRQVETLSMGWCVNCHRDNEAADDCAACHY
ncbi:MAG: cytochrome c3 family protein [Gemmatimonadetes bacterium]|nr:cytochrome c3 family protein [Gemmatimonadota bacterium]